MENNGHIGNLFQKYLDNQLSEAELEELLQYFELSADHGSLGVLIRRELDKPAADTVNRGKIESLADRAGYKVFQKTRPKGRAGWRRYLPYAAAILLLPLAYGIYLYRLADSHQGPAVRVIQFLDIAPGGNRATLTLSSGKLIRLDTTQQGIIAGPHTISYSDGTVILDKLTSGHQSSQADVPSDDLNSLVTPRGGMYQIVLSDSTKVWLNAASELRYPSIFSGNSRKVILSGEAYFEVAAAPNRPFVVETADQVTRVLGTSFNICAYQDLNEVRTTLVKGSVQLSGKTRRYITLEPGQEAIHKAGEDRFSVSKADIGEVNAWHNGYFSFNNKSIVHIMQQVARWYDVDVTYKGDINGRKFGGVVKRSKTLSHVLDIFKETGTLSYQIEGRRVTIMVR